MIFIPFVINVKSIISSDTKGNEIIFYKSINSKATIYQVSTTINSLISAICGWRRKKMYKQTEARMG